MADFGRAKGDIPAVSEPPKPKFALVSRNELGELCYLPVSEMKHKEITKSGNVSEYVKASLSGNSIKPKASYFLPLYEAKKCFYCIDTTLQMAWVNTTHGKRHYAFACACHGSAAKPIGGDALGSCVGVVDLTCQLAPDCTFTSKQAKCQQFNCPKFGG